jgi:XTP/dITP diphosphohydrolase
MASEILFASNNLGKIREVREILAELGLTVISQSEYGVTDDEETGLTFIENAIIKARHAARLSMLPALADDSGLEVDALNGSPGVFSARYAGIGASDADNNAKLIKALECVPHSSRTARFRCVMAYLRHADDPSPVIAEGIWEGLMLDEPRGSGGFGYDPYFFVPDKGCTSAELSAEIKNNLSHRSQALRRMAAELMRLSSGR